MNDKMLKLADLISQRDPSLDADIRTVFAERDDLRRQLDAVRAAIGGGK